MEAAFCWLRTVLLLCCLRLYLPANYFQFSYLSPKRFPSKSTSRETFCCPFLNLTTSLFLILIPLQNQSRPTHSQSSDWEGRQASSTKWLHPAEGRNNRTIWASLLPHPWISTSSPASLVVFVGQTHPCPVAIYTSTCGSHQTHSSGVMSFNHQIIQVLRPVLLRMSLASWYSAANNRMVGRMYKTNANISIWVALLVLMLSTPSETPLLLRGVVKPKATPETGSKWVHWKINVCLQLFSEMYMGVRTHTKEGTVCALGWSFRECGLAGWMTWEYQKVPSAKQWDEWRNEGEMAGRGDWG